MLNILRIFFFFALWVDSEIINNVRFTSALMIASVIYESYVKMTDKIGQGNGASMLLRVCLRRRSLCVYACAG